MEPTGALRCCGLLATELCCCRGGVVGVSRAEECVALGVDLDSALGSACLPIANPGSDAVPIRSRTPRPGTWTGELAIERRGSI